MNEKRFRGSLGEEYELLKLSYPDHDELQDQVKYAIKKYLIEAPEKSEYTALEVGTGLGLTTIRILDADERIKVITIDNEAKMIAQAKENLKDKNSRIAYVTDDALTVLKKMPDKFIDIVASAFTIHNFEPQVRADLLKEIARVLVSGGFFVNADKIARDDLIQHKKDSDEQISALDVYEEMGKKELKEEWIKHYHEDEAIRITESEYKKILADLDFKEIETIYRKRLETVIIAVR